MQEYKKITKKELYLLCLQHEIDNLESMLVPHEYTPATMFHSHKGGWVREADKSLLIRGGNPHIPNLSDLHDRYGDMPGIANDYRNKLVAINSRLEIARRAKEEFLK